MERESGHLPHTAQAEVTTDRASRYLVQICSHLGEIRGHAQHGGAPSGPDVRDVDWDERRGVITFAAGECTLDATDTRLQLRLRAGSADDLHWLQRMLGARLETIGRRDGLAVAWQQT